MTFEELNLSRSGNKSTDIMTNQLTKEELHQLKKSEALIEMGIKTFYNVGRELIKIRDQKLYRQDYATFEEYCDKRWGFVARHGNRLMEAATVFNNLEKNRPIGSETPLPTNERQTRALAHVPEADQPAVWQEAVKEAESTGKKVTAELVEKKVDEYSDKHPQVADIPARPAVEATNIVTKGLRRINCQKLLDKLTDLVCTIETSFPAEHDLLIADLQAHIDRIKGGSVKSNVVPLERKTA
jgi:hypothetical protein